MKLKKTFLYGFSILSLTCLSSAQDAPKGPSPEGGQPGRPPGGPQGGPPGGGGDPAERIAAFIKRADTNNDGKISKEEFEVLGKKESEERFGRMDGNSDGFVDQDEIGKMAQMARQGQGGQGGQGMRRPEGGPPGGEGGGFRRPPGGEGGSPGGSPGGAPQGQGMRPGGEGGGQRGGAMFDPKERFKSMDTDGNGSISEDEYIKGTEKMREMFRRGGQGGPGGPGMNRPGEGGAPGGAGGPPGEGQGGFRRPPVEGDAPKAPEAPAPAPAPDKPKDPA
jgi:hypothetical protein